MFSGHLGDTLAAEGDTLSVKQSVFDSFHWIWGTLWPLRGPDGRLANNVPCRGDRVSCPAERGRMCETGEMPCGPKPNTDHHMITVLKAHSPRLAIYSL